MYTWSSLNWLDFSPGFVELLVMVVDASVNFQSWNDKRCYYEREKYMTKSNEIKIFTVNEWHHPLMLMTSAMDH